MLSVFIGSVIFIAGAFVGMVLMACVAANGDRYDDDVLEEFNEHEPEL